MSFYIHSPKMGNFLEELIERFEKDSRPDLHRKIAITWVCYDNLSSKPLTTGTGAGWLGNKLIYPASVVKLFYACAIETWIYKELLEDSLEVRTAMGEMIAHSSNDATSYIVDLLTGTTSGPSLYGERWNVWKKQRNWINDWLNSFNWDELKAVNCCQKTWSDGPFGREKDFYGAKNQNRNALSTNATARLLEALMSGLLLSPRATKNLKRLLFRSLDLTKRKADPNNQVDGFLGEGLPKGTQLWSKAGLMSEVRHDAAWFVTPTGKTMLLIVFIESKAFANDNFLLPAFASELSKWNVA